MFCNPESRFEQMTNTLAHCNRCGGNRNHAVLHVENTSWESDDKEVSGGDSYETLKCLGCDAVCLRHTSWFSEEPEPDISYFPPAISRKRPAWYSDFVFTLNTDQEFVATLLNEIYIALQNNMPSLAAMGVRSVLERIMISKVEDLGTFAKNIAEFERMGFVSRIQKERIEAILEVGHAAIHRRFKPTVIEVNTLIDIVEHVVETVYLHEPKIAELRKRIPPRRARNKQAAAS